jgi:DNA-binding transcriptional ArsR family regulator
MSNRELARLNGLNRVIHEPARLMIVALLSGVKEADFVFLMRETRLTKGNLSSHLAKLEIAGYVTVTKTYRGKIPLTVISLTQSGRIAFDAYRKELRQIV